MCLINAKFCEIPNKVYVVRVQYKNQNDDWLFWSPFQAKVWEIGKKEIADCSTLSAASIIQDDACVYSGAFHSFANLEDAMSLVEWLSEFGNKYIGVRIVFEAQPGGITGKGTVRLNRNDNSFMPKGYFSTELTLIDAISVNINKD